MDANGGDGATARTAGPTTVSSASSVRYPAAVVTGEILGAVHTGLLAVPADDLAATVWGAGTPGPAVRRRTGP